VSTALVGQPRGEDRVGELARAEVDLEIAQEVDRDEREVELGDAGVERQEEADVVILSAEGARQSGGDIAEASGLGEGGHFSGDLTDPQRHRGRAFLVFGSRLRGFGRSVGGAGGRGHRLVR
jgi:hypothetical protein